MSTKIPLDYETKKEYTLVVRAFNKQADQKPLSMEETCEIVVTVNDVNEPPKWSDNVPEFMEGHKEGTLIDKSNLLDPDFSNSEILWYT